jgi:Glycosyltransferase family 87
MAAVATAAMAWLGLYGFAWNDYELEAQPAVDALVRGHLGTFFAGAPVYGGSLLERAPFALAPGVWGGGELAVYRMLALPCLLAALGLGLSLVVRTRSLGASRLVQGVALGLCVANPLTLAALELGHPEELMGGALCLAAVLLASSGRPVWAGLALGAAVANKPWALMALGPMLVALPSRRMLSIAVAGSVSTALLAPFVLSGESALAATHGAANAGGAIFTPLQIWWFFGHHGHVVHGLFGAIKPYYRTAPGWTGTISHPLIVIVALPLTLAVWTRLRRSDRQPDVVRREQRKTNQARSASAALLLLVLLLLLRCMLDTWDNIYYPIPFVLALTAWEALTLQRAPILALSSVILLWADCRWLPSFASADVQAACFMAWTIPLAGGLALALYAPKRLGRLSRVRPNRHLPQPLALTGGEVHST